MESLLVAGSLFLIIALVLAWLLVFVRILNVEFFKRIFPADDNLLKAHIDYILMSLLVYMFYGLSDELPVVIIVPMLFGAAMNPFLFIVMATKDPKNPKKPGPFFMALVMLSFVSTTVGFGGAALALIL